GIRIGKRKRKPKRLGLDKGYDSEPHRRACVNDALFPSLPIVRTRSPFRAGVRPKLATTGVIAASGGKWSGRSVGSTYIGDWTVCWNRARNPIVPSCESFSLNTIWMPYFPDPNEF